MKKRTIRPALATSLPALVFLLLIAGCASQSPVLYPNAQLRTAGEQRAQADIQNCMQMADAYIKSNPAGEVARDTAIGGVGGAVVGGAIGAATGSFGSGIGVGAAAGAAAGLVHGIFKTSQPSPLYKSYVDRCLRERGYEPMGWQ